VCHCTPAHPCRIPGGDECAFVNAKADLCNAPGCIITAQIQYDQMIERNRDRMRLIRKLSKSKKQNGHRRAA
jgi:hypothetical protein